MSAFTIEEMQAAAGLIAIAMRVEGVGYAALLNPHVSSFAIKLEAAAAKAMASETEMAKASKAKVEKVNG